MAYIRGIDVIGKSLMDMFNQIGGKITEGYDKQNQANQTAPLIHQLFNPDPVQNTTYAPQGGRIQNPDGTLNPMSPTTTTTPGPPPWAPENAQALAEMNRLDPTTTATLMGGYNARMAASKPEEFNLSEGEKRFSRAPWDQGGKITEIAHVDPKEVKGSTTPTQHLGTQIDPTDTPVKQGGTGKLMQPEYQTSADPVTKIASYMHQAGYDPVKGLTDQGYEKKMRVINNMKDMTPPSGGAGGAGKWIAGPKDAMGRIISYVNLTTNQVKTPKDLGLPDVEAPLTSNTRTMIETSGTAKALATEALSIINNKDKIGELGPLSSRWREFSAGKIGASDPEFMRFRTIALDLLPTLIMRMHTGARGNKDLVQKFTNMIGADSNTPENLRAVLGEVSNYADIISAEQHGVPSDKNSKKIGKFTIEKVE